MKLLFVAATWNEIQPLEQFLLKEDQGKKLRNHSIELCITGPGSALTAFHLGKMLPTIEWDYVINLGICGSFRKEIPIGTVVNVTEDCFADLGAEDGDEFLDAFDLKLLDTDKFPFEGKMIRNNSSGIKSIAEILTAKGITVNKVHGNEASIAKTLKRFPAAVESMEGAAFMYCCKKESRSFFQIRAVSNFVERRDKGKWDIPLAIKTLNATALKIVNELLNS